MNRLYKAFALLFASVFFFQCQKDLSYIGGPDTGVSSNPVKATLQGNITDENNEPAAGVNITVGTATVTTNSAGYFRISQASLDKNTSLITAEKPGYFKGYRVFSATEGTNQVFIKLVKKDLTGTVPSSGGSVSLSNGAKVTLPENSVVTAANAAAYSGTVNIYASYIDPSANDIAQKVPGSFVANDKNGKRVVLSSYGMLAVELGGDNGEKLQVKTGAVATLTIPIPSSFLSSAPATIPLWYLDEQTGVWKEEGVASKQGNNYVGTVKHFSFWNCDYPFDAVTLSLTLKNSSKLPLSFATVKVTVSNSSDTASYSAFGYTDSAGEVKGYVPANKNLLIEVLDPCGNMVYSKNVPALTQNTDLGTIGVTGSSASMLTFEGMLLDCNGAPVTNGFAIISFNNIVRYAATDGSGKYTTNFIICPGTPGTADITGIDQSTQQQSPASSVTVTAPVTSVGDITACGTSSAQFINYTLDGTDHTITSAVNDSIIGFSSNQGNINVTSITGSQRIADVGKDNISFTVNSVTAPGTYPVSTLYVQNSGTILTTPFNVTFTSFPASTGEFYEGSFSGQYRVDSTAGVHSISSTFRVRRNF